MKKIFYALIAIVALISATCACAADDSGGSALQYDRPGTGYTAIIWDDADLLSDDEEARLLEIMKPITAYGHAVFSTDTNEEGTRTSDLAEGVLMSVCDPSDSGTILEIDLENGMIYIFSIGDIYDVVTTSRAEAITDGVVGYASDGRWADCASEAFRQISRLLAGQSASAGAPSASGGSALQYDDPETGYSAVIWDGAELLSDEEEAQLLEIMKPITAYGHAVFSTDTNDAGTSTRDLAESVLRKICDKRESGTIFEIDMKNRMLYIFSDGAIYDIVTSSYADTITDNVYRYATDGRYFACASEAFGQIRRLLVGQNIPAPMKHTNNVLLALAFGIFMNFVVLNVLSKKNDRATAQGAIVYHGRIKELNVEPGPLKRVYSPKKSSSSGGGGGGGGGSGGGGGHRF